MLNEEQTKRYLLLGYHIGKLYADAGLTAREISVHTEIPVSSVKRYIKMIIDRKEEYLNLFPELFSDDNLTEIGKEIIRQKESNIKTTKWKTDIAFDSEINQERLKSIIYLYQGLSTPQLTNDDKRRILDLRFNEDSMRKIASETGFALSTIHKTIADEKESRARK